VGPESPWVEQKVNEWTAWWSINPLLKHRTMMNGTTATGLYRKETAHGLINRTGFTKWSIHSEKQINRIKSVQVHQSNTCTHVLSQTPGTGVSDSM
jgi:hypothetical protein